MDFTGVDSSPCCTSSLIPVRPEGPGVDDPVKSLKKCRAEHDEECAARRGADPRRGPGAAWRNRERREDDDEDKDIIDRQRSRSHGRSELTPRPGQTNGTHPR